MANLEYQSVFNGAYFMFSTFEAGTTNFKVYRRNASGTGWDSSPILSRNISPGSPYMWSPGNGNVQEFFRYAKWKKKNPKIDQRYNSTWLKTGHYGLKIVATNNIYVRTVLQPDAKDGGSKTEYGAGTNTHGAAFSSKGISRGAGVEFYSAHFYSEGKVASNGDQDFISVMSLEDGNNIKLHSSQTWTTPNGNAAITTITLNEGESAIFKRSWQQNRNSLGTRIYSTNDKEMVVTSGSWAGKLTDGVANAQDIGIEQLVPVKALGKKYLISQSKTLASTPINSTTRQGIVVVAVEEGTTSYTFNGTSYTLSRGGKRFHYIPGFSSTNTTSGPYEVISDKKLLVTHQIFANPDSNKTNQFGMTILGPIYNSYTSPGYNKISLAGGYYEHALWDTANENLAIYYMTNASDAELNSLASGKVKFQGTTLNPISSFNSAGSKTIDGETWKIRYRETTNPHNNFTNESFFDFSTIDKPVYVWWQVGFKLQGNISSISPYQVGGCDVPTITQQPSITPNNANEGANSQLRVTTSPSSNVSYTWQISPDGISWEDLSSGAVSSTTFSSPTAATVNLTGLSLDLDDYQFRVIVENATDASCVVTSTAVTLNVNCTNPTITGQPTDVTVAPGTATSFTVTGTHANGVTYKWYRSTDGGSSYNPLNNYYSTQQTFLISNPTLSDDGQKYKARVYNSKDTSCYVESNVATLNVAAANDCPVYNPITLAPGLKEDRDDIVVNLNSFVTDADSDTVSFTNISSNNTTLVAATLSGTASLVLSFQENQSGSAQISFDYTDGNSGCDNTATFNVNIQPVNDCPTANTSLSDISTTWNSDDQTISLSTLFNDVDTTNLTYTVTNTDNSIITTTISGTNLIIDYLDNQYGTVTVTVGVDQIGSVSNGSSVSACTVSDTFVITILKPNQEPSFTKGPNINLCENSGAYTATGWATNIDDGDLGTQNVSFEIISNNNPAIFDVQPQISATGTLTFTLKANRSGNVTLLARIEDDGGTANGGDNQSEPQTFYINVNQEDNPDFNFQVTGSTITEICEDDSRSIDLIVYGTSTQGTFTVSPSGIMSFTYVSPSRYNFTVNSTGTATITFTTSGTCPGTVTKTITLSAAEDPSFSYSAATFCSSDSDPYATITGTSGGVFSSSTGLVFTDTASGTIDLSSSTAGSYTVTYTTGGICATATSTLITIESDDMSFTYDSASYSQSCPNPTPTITGITSGTFSSSASLTIDVNTGEITTSTSSPGTYTVTYSLTIPNSSTTSWTKAIDFSGSNEHLSQISIASSDKPLMMGELATTVNTPTTSGNTSADNNARPWATAIVFKSDGKNSTQHIWNQGEGASDGDDNIFLKVDAANQLQLVWGRSGGPLNQCRIEASISTNTWYAVYIAHNGSRFSAADATASNLSNAFDIRVMSSADSFSSLSANKSTSSNWFSTGAAMSNSILGNLTIGGRGDNRNFDGKVASMLVTTLLVDQPMPNATEITKMITDPAGWLDDYKTGNDYRFPWTKDTSINFQKVSRATQVWLMGEIPRDSYPTTIANYVDTSVVASYNQRMTMNNMSSNDIENVNINGLTSQQASCATPASFEVTITAAVNADFSYPSTPYCSSSANVTPTVTGQSGGSFTVPSGVSLVSSSTGEIDISASTPGSYTVSYTVIECGSSITATTTLEISASVTATIAYGSATYSDNDADPTPTITGHVTGTFTASPTGLSFTSTSTGEIDLSASTLGTYEISFTPSATCSIPVTTTLKIQGCPYVENPIGYPLTIPSSQIAFYEFEGDGEDSIGSYDLTITGAATYENQQSQGVSSTFKGQSILFKQAGQYASVDFNQAFSSASGLTVSTWIKIKEINPGFAGSGYNYIDLVWWANANNLGGIASIPKLRTFVSLRSSSTSRTIHLNGDTAGGEIRIKNDEDAINNTLLDTENKWHNLAYTIDFNNQDARLYIDGELYGNDKFTGDFSTTDFLFFGDYTAPNNQFMYDEMRVFDTALTSKEIRNIAHTSQHQRSTTATPQTDPTFDLSNVFTDPNSNDTLTYTASVTYESENGLASVSISSSTLTVDINDASEGGNAVIEVTASDGTCSSTHTFNLIVLPDKDQDGIADEDDLDDDNDGILDTVEGTDTDGDGIPDDDADGDGLPNHLDTDSDNDGCLDSEEAGYFLGTTSIVVDAQGRRINDNQGPITLGTDAYTASNTLLDINGNSVRDYLEDGPTIALTYGESYYCTSGTDPTPTLNFTVSGIISGTISPTGTFTASPTGLVFSNSSSGTIDLSASVSNTYIITFNSTVGGCPSTVTTTLQIIGQDDPTFSYDSATYCLDDSNPIPTITTPGGTFSSSASLTLNATTGEITTSTSSPGTYTVTYTTAGTCTDTSSVEVTIYPLDDASFSYPSSSYCVSDTDPVPTRTASQTIIGGTFTSSSGLSLTSSSTGIIDLSASTPGTYTVTYTTAGNCPQSSSVTVTINDLDDASFSYAKAAYCVNESDPSAVITGITSGTFSSLSGLVFSNTSSGTIDLDGSTPGTYTVTYTTSGTCTNTSSFDITINGLDNADFNFDNPTYCVGGTDPTPTITGLSGGVFSSTASLSLDTASGTIDLSASSPGSYTVTYTTAGPCSNTSSFNITIVAQDDGTFSYGSLLYCKGDTNPTPTVSEYTAGTFVSTAGLSFVSSSTGEIDLSASVSGTYTVSYTTGGTCTVTTSQIIQIAEKDDASFSFPRTNYTLNCDNPTPTITGLTGGVWEAPAGLTINPSTGEINLSASASGTYTVSYTVNNLCVNTATTTIILSSADDPYFSYSKYSYCVNESDPTPLSIATVSGTFSGSASITVNATTGAIDISASSVGEHVITYTTSSTCPSTSSRTITITPLEDATFTFSSSSYCKGSSNVSPTITNPGGTFTSPANLYMNASTGLINIALSTPGTYTVTYTTAGTCTNTSTGTITINALDNASFSYAKSNYCSNDSDPSATISGLTGGTFSSTAGLVFTNTSSGTIDLDGSTPGTYTVTYTTAGTCTNTAGFELTITAQDSATISYSSATYCPLESDPTPTITGYATGTYSSTTGLVINTATGAIDVSASTSGTYTVSYTTQGSCPITVTTTVQIIECPDTDGDGVPDITENSDGTDPNDPCDYVVNSQDASKTTNAWKNADCDGDGVTNNQEIIDETDPNDVCSYEPTSQVIGNVTAAWNNADCDGDGITNEDENTDGTDEFDSCNGVNGSVTLPITTTTDCDGDGSIGDDPDNLSPGGACSWGTQDLSLTTPFWRGLDCDGDGVTNGNEINDGTDPQNACDYTYSSISLTVSATNDCDGDGVGNDQEALDGTDPSDVCSYISSSVSLTLVTGTWNSADCDGDGVTNGKEVTDGTDWASVCSFTFASQTVSPSADWNAADCDGDGVTNGQEVTDGTDPTDGCSYTASNITLNQSSAWRDLDCDQDGVTNGQELTDGTDPKDTCSYNAANQVIANVGATWNAADCDGDSVTNGQEVIEGTSPTDTCSYTLANFNVASTTATWQNADCDQDGVPNSQENTDGTDPKDTCDYDVNNQVLANVGATWNAADCDSDGVTNGQEVIDNTGTSSPCDFVTENITGSVSATLDCDGDSVPNAQELIDGTDPKSSCDYLIANFNVASVTATWDALDCDGDGVINGTEKGITDYHDDCSFTTASITVSVTSTSDCDGDGVTNAQEDIDNTDPKDECSFTDASITIVPTTPKDCDGDGVLDTDEEIDGTDANDICDFVFASQSTSTIALWATLDCDGDGVTNGDEITDGTNPKEVCNYLSTSVSSTLVSETWNLADCDGDGVTNGDESDDFTDPLDPCYFDFNLQTVSPTTAWNNLDCDGDGVTNGDELTDNSNPLFSCDFIVESITVTVTSNLDCDADGVSNANEYIDGTDPLDPCEANVASIDRIATAIKDCDQDGVDDEIEALNGTDPNDACSYNSADITMEVTTDEDCDGDGVPNSIEIEIDQTDPNDNCDFNADNVVLDDASLAWKNADCDGDGVPNGQEITDGTDPKDLCSNVIVNQTLTPSADWNAADCNNDGYCNACPIPEPSTGGGGGGSRTRTPNNSTSTPTIDDLDGDGIEDSLDDDDDGDGIPDDQDEFPRDGTEWDDLDGDGVGDNKDVDDDNDGINDDLESPNGNEDFDGDGIPNYLDLDSDNDGCPDVIEAGYVDQDGDFILSDTDGIEFNEIGQVISDSGYSYPADNDNNGILDFLEEGSQVEIIVNPVSRAAILSGRNIILQVEATSLGTIEYQWQVNKSGITSKGNQWETIDNGDLYLGTKSDKLIIRKATSNMDGWRYRAIAFSPCYVCGDVVESEPTELYFTPLSIPKGFSPNGDGFNDTWVIEGLENYVRNKLTIYNRWETKVYEKVNYQNDWDGSSYVSGFGGTNTLPDGIYFYILELDNEKPITGYIYLKNQ
ncbi:gliding motility-associated C-terminal domain-containing protein [Flavobacteriaceae bacterium]|nr:gliding motility-associated C-terminal domain-containing protein [Flavobacteriaceae bacterium]